MREFLRILPRLGDKLTRKAISAHPVKRISTGGLPYFRHWIWHDSVCDSKGKTPNQ
jgi:hypothetical protein